MCIKYKGIVLWAFIAWREDFGVKPNGVTPDLITIPSKQYTIFYTLNDPWEVTWIVQTASPPNYTTSKCRWWTIGRRSHSSGDILPFSFELLNVETNVNLFGRSSNEPNYSNKLTFIWCDTSRNSVLSTLVNASIWKTHKRYITRGKMHTPVRTKQQPTEIFGKTNYMENSKIQIRFI